MAPSLRRLTAGVVCSGVVAGGLPAEVPGDVSAWWRAGEPLVQRYPIQQTGVNGMPRVIAQIPSGELAVGTDRGLFLYDGQRWRTLPGHSGVSSLVSLPDGRVFIGSGSEIHELRPDGRGSYTSRPRTDELLRDRPDSIVYSLTQLGGTVYGLDGPRVILISDTAEPRIVDLPTWGAAVFEFKGHVYVRTAVAEAPVYRFEPKSGTFEQANDLALPLRDEPLTAQTRDEAGILWFATGTGELVGTDGRQSRSFPAQEIDSIRRVHGPVQSLQALPGGAMALATIERGLVLLGADGSVVESVAAIDAPGLPKRIYTLGLDLDGGLWVGAALELTRVDARMRSTVFGERRGLVGEVWAIARSGGRLYVGTDSGLFTEEEPAPPAAAQFTAVPDIPAVRSLAVSAEGLWIAADRLLLLTPAGEVQDFGEATRDPNPIVLPRAHPGWLVVGVRDGLRVLRRVDGRWQDAGAVPGVHRPVFSMAETAAGDLWASYGTGTIVRVRWRGDGLEVREFGEREGIPNRWLHPGTRGDDVFLGSDHGTLMWSEAAGRFGPTTTLSYYGGSEPFGFDPVFMNGNEAWIWPQTTVGTLVPRPEAEVLAAMAVATGHVRARGRSAFYDTDGVVWVGLPAGLLRHTRTGATARPSPGVHLRRLVDLRTGEPIIGGVSRDQPIELSARQNSIRVEAAIPRFFGDRFQQFQIELRGVGHGGLPPYEARATRDFTNLEPGRYKLVLAARDGTGRTAVPLTLSLLVRAPVYASSWAYFVYALAGAGLIAGLVRWRLVRLRRHADRLRAAVDMRTSEIWRQSALLADEKQLFASLAAAAPVGIWRGDGQGHVVFANAALEQICGRPSERIIREGWLPSVHPEDRAQAGALMHSALAEREARSMEIRFIRPDGEVRWVIAGLAPVRAGEGGAWLVGTALDLTERRDVERRMMRAQRLESIGTLTGGIAHDLNNALVPILAGASLFEGELSAENRAVLLDIERSAKRAAAMVRQLLAFARGMDGERIRLDLVPLLRELGRILDRTFPKNIVLHQDFRAGSGWVQGDPTQLHQVFLNLCVNSRDAMPDGGTLTIELETRTIDGAQDAFQEPIPPGTYRVITVTDTGTGMTQEVLEHIFDPFFTTKGPDRGTGLGLSTTLGIVRGHSGFVAVDTKVGAGTRFSVYLPAMHASVDLPADAPTTDAEPAQPAATLTLVVDDEVTVRSVVSRGLQRLGLRCLEAPNGAQGLEVWNRHRTEIGLIIADLSMPVMDGVTFIRELRPLARRLPIIVITGNLTDDHRRDLQTLHVERIIQKPFRFEELASAVRELLS